MAAKATDRKEQERDRRCWRAVAQRCWYFSLDLVSGVSKKPHQSQQQAVSILSMWAVPARPRHGVRRRYEQRGQSGTLG